MKNEVKNEMVFKAAGVNVRILATDSDVKLEISSISNPMGESFATVVPEGQTSIFDVCTEGGDAEHLLSDLVSGDGGMRLQEDDDFRIASNYLSTIGLKLQTEWTDDENTIRAVSEVMNEFRSCGKDGQKFLAPFKTILAAWPDGGKRRFQGAILKDISAFEMKHWGEYNESELVKHLAKDVTQSTPYTPQRFLGDIKMKSEIPGAATAMRYNLGRRKDGNNRLFMN